MEPELEIKHRGRPKKIPFESKEFIPDEEDIKNDHPSIESAPIDGTNIKVSEDGIHYVMAYWRRTRCFKNHQWAPTGKWCDPLTHRDISFCPKFWRE